MNINVNPNQRNQSFGSLVYGESALRLIAKRINPKKVHQVIKSMHTFQDQQALNGVNVELLADETGKKFIAKFDFRTPFVSSFGEEFMVHSNETMKESTWNAFFNASPLKFIKKICAKADSIKDGLKVTRDGISLHI